MALTLKQPAGPTSVAAPPRRSAAPPPRKAFRDNTKLLLAGIAVLLAAQAQRFARALAPMDLAATPSGQVREVVAPDVLQERIALVEVYRVGARTSPGAPPVVRITEVAAPAMPQDYSRVSSDRLAERTA